jgi:leader peptidase (prepilin peptidase) / N-methyltransferase
MGVVGAVLAAGLIGLVGGAAIPVVSYRLAVELDEPNRETCVDCGRRLTGWVRLPNRCPHCGHRFGPPFWLTAGVAAVACGLIAAAIGAVPVLYPFVGLAVFGVLLGTIDLACRRLPHVLVLPAIGVSAVILLAIAAVTGDWSTFGRAGAGAGVMAGFYGLLYLLPGRGVGLGDVTLGVLLGEFLGWLGWREVILGALLPWLVSLPILVVGLASGRLDRKATVPFGPSMLVAALLAVVAGSWLAMFGRS